MSESLIAPIASGVQQLRVAQTHSQNDIATLLARRGMKFRVFTESGEWICPGPDTPVYVIAVGGGSGGIFTGGSYASTSDPGGDSAFGGFITATGGASVTGRAGTSGVFTPVDTGYFGFGSGGAGAVSTGQYETTRGKKGSMAEGYFVVSDDQPVTVGAGSPCVGSPVFSAGDGVVIVFWWEVQQ